MNRRRNLLLTAAACLFAASRVSGQDLQRGLRNYQDVLAGRKKLEQLSPAERDEVLRVYGIIQSRSSATGARSECRDAKARAESAASELGDYSRRLRNCAEAQDFSDDCDTEFRRVKDAHSDYESAVSDVTSYCR
jgi:hypothetical protein